MIFTKSIPIIIDIGSYNIKSGFSGDEAPCNEFPTYIGLPKNKAIIVGPDTKECFIGNEAIEKKGVLNLFNPIQKGNIVEWSHFEKILHHSFFSELLVDISKFPFMLIANPNFTEENSKILTEVVFENFNVPSFYLGLSNLLSLFSIGKNNGLVIDSGHGVTNILSVFEGYPILDNLITTNNAGESLSNSLIKELQTNNIQIDKFIAKDIKEKHIYLEESLIEDEDENNSNKLILPDNNEIIINKNMRNLPYKQFFDNPGNNYDELLMKVIDNSDDFILNDLLNNVYVNGGNTNFNNFNKILSKKFNERIFKSERRNDYLKDKRKININDQKDKVYSSWIGGSLLSCLSTFENLWISKKEYEEYGNDIILRKCLI